MCFKACLIADPNRSSDVYKRAASYCEEVLKYDPSNTKAQYRRSIAYFLAKDFIKALPFLREVDESFQGSGKILGFYACCF